MYKKQYRIIAAAVVAIIIFNIGAVFAKEKYSLDYNVFSGDTVSAAFVGDKNIFTDNMTVGTSEIIGKKYQKQVKSENVSISNADSGAVYAASEKVKNKDLILIAIERKNEKGMEFKQNIELSVRSLIEKNKDVKIVMIITSENSDELIEISQYYNLGTVRFDEYLKRRTDAGVVKESEIINNGGLTKDGEVLLSECIGYFCESAFLNAVYVKESLTGKYTAEADDESQGEKSEPESISTEEIDSILSQSVIVSAFEHYAVVNGEKVGLNLQDAALPGILDQKLCYPVYMVKALFKAKIKYLPGERKIVISCNDNEMQLSFGSSMCCMNGEDIDIDYPVMLYKGTTYIPERGVAMLTEGYEYSDGEIGIIYPNDYELSENDKKILSEKAKVILNNNK